jgi:ribosomal protein S18 acetylase RimI-like enzyme
MLPEDVESVVLVHTESFPGFFLSSLGPGFLRLFYKAVLNDANGIAVIAERQDAVIGFACGSSAPRGFYRRLLRQQWWKFGWAAMRAVVCRPSMIRHLLGAVRARVAPIDDDPAAELMSVATAPQAQRQGVGEVLVSRFLSEARRSGAGRVTLSTDRHANQQVNSFYRRLGFTLATSFVTNTGREMNLYEISTLIVPDGR